MPTVTSTPIAVRTSVAVPTMAAAARYPWHTDIVATTFWVGEIFDPNAADGSQMMSAYDDRWFAHYGGCDGVVVDQKCSTEARREVNGWFPTAMSPKQNPFYLDLPFDDVNNAAAARTRSAVVPWASEARYQGLAPGKSLMKNRWVELRRGGRGCFGQIEDAGPGTYDDAAYVFGTVDRRPANRRYNGAGLDVSPALNGCLAFTELNGENDRLDWRFVDDADVPSGPWTKLITSA